jgi:RNA 2',3'-cyclic 3'-phosphodiesterase
VRSFLALEIPEDIVAYLGAVVERLAKRSEGVRWVRQDAIHITVKFLGEIGEETAQTMYDAVGPMAGRYAAVKARLGQLDAFPSTRSARVIVVKVREGIEEIQAIFSEIEERLEGIHVAREKREFVPHITLGRRRIPKAFPNGDPTPVEEKEFLIENLVLFRSTLTPSGAIYAPIWRIKLGGED